MNKTTQYLSSLLVISFLTTGCTYKDFEIHQQNDHLRDCKQLTTQIANIIDINSNVNTNTGLENNSIVSWVFWPPIAIYNQVNASFVRGNLDDRLDHLLNLKYKNGCNITNRETIYIKDKGRFSDIF